MGCYFHLVFSPHNFSSLRFFRRVFSHGCAGHMPKTNYFSVGSPQCICQIPFMLAACIWCMLSVLCVHYLQWQHSHSCCKLSHCTWVLKCSAWCMLRLNRSEQSWFVFKKPSHSYAVCRSQKPKFSRVFDLVCFQLRCLLVSPGAYDHRFCTAVGGFEHKERHRYHLSIVSCPDYFSHKIQSGNWSHTQLT